MSQNLLDKMKNIMFTIFNHWVIFPIIIGVMVLLQKELKIPVRVQYLEWAICGMYPLMARFVFEHAKKLWQFMACHIMALIFFWAFFIWTSDLPIIYGIAVFVYFDWFIYRKFSVKYVADNQLFSLVIPIAESLVSLVIMYYFDIKAYERLFVAMNFIFWVCYMLLSYMDHYFMQIKTNESSAGHVPKRAIFKSGFTMVLCYMGIGIVGLLLCADFSALKYALLFLAGVVIVGIEVIILLFSLIKRPQQTVIEIEEKIPMIIPKQGKTFFDDIVSVAVSAVVFIVIALLLFILLRAIIRFLIQIIRRYRPSGETDVDNAFVKDVREKCEKKGSVSEKKSRFTGPLSNVEKIRKMYRKKLVADKEFFEGVGQLGNKENFRKDRTRITAREYGIQTDNESLTEIYEKARYSEAVCDRTDVKRMKEACR